MHTIDLGCVIDDDPIYIFGIRKMIELTGCCKELLVFKNGKEAIDKLTDRLANGKELPAIILLDINMPIMDGWQFLDEFIRIPAHAATRVYMVSSSVSHEDTERARLYTVVADYITKPIGVARLRQITNDYFAGRNLANDES